VIIWCWSVKGGVGTSVVAAAIALRLAHDGRDTTLVDLEGDQPELLGLVRGAAPSEPGIGDWIAAGEGVPADAIGRLLEEVTRGLRLLRAGSVSPAGADPARLKLAFDMLSGTGPVVVDAGLDPGNFRAELGEPHRSVCVLRSCFLAVSRAQRIADDIDHVILVTEPGRSLRSSDVAAAVGAGRVDRIAWDPRVARTIDAGTIVGVLPMPLRRFELPI